MECYAYLRVSTQDQELANQRQAIKAYAEATPDHSVSEWYGDVETGKSRSRKRLNDMLQDIREGSSAERPDAIIVYKLDRMGRSLKHLLDIIQELENKDIDFISVTEGFDTSDPGGKLFFQIAGAFAEYESNLISERTKEGMKRAKKQGKHVGRPPKGE